VVADRGARGVAAKLFQGRGLQLRYRWKHRAHRNRRPFELRGYQSEGRELPFAGAQFDAGAERSATYANRIVVIILGVVLLILGLVFNLHLLWALGIIVSVIGAVFWTLGAIGRPIAGRRYWY
jgi:hypothetical protein